MMSLVQIKLLNFCLLMSLTCPAIGHSSRQGILIRIMLEKPGLIAEPVLNKIHPLQRAFY